MTPSGHIFLSQTSWALFLLWLPYFLYKIPVFLYKFFRNTGNQAWMQEPCKISCISCFTGFSSLLNFIQGYRTGPVHTGNRTLLQGFIQDRMPSPELDVFIFARFMPGILEKIVNQRRIRHIFF